MAQEPTREEYIAVLNRFTTSSIAQILKVSETAVENWKTGQEDFGGNYGIVRRRVVELLEEQGTSIAA